MISEHHATHLELSVWIDAKTTKQTRRYEMARPFAPTAVSRCWVERGDCRVLSSSASSFARFGCRQNLFSTAIQRSHLLLGQQHSLARHKVLILSCIVVIVAATRSHFGQFVLYCFKIWLRFLKRVKKEDS